MTRPTDDELEAMAARLDRKTHNMIEGHAQMEEAAAMLRACMGRVRVKPYKRHGSMYDYRIYDVHQGNKYGICSAFLERDQWGSRVQVAKCVSLEDAKAAAQADYEARILSTLEPAPDQGEWNAAIEAAARAVMNMQGRFPMGTPQANAAHDVAIVRLTEIIRALKKGQTND